MLAQCVFFQYLAVIEADCLFPIMLGRLNARARFRSMAEASIPLSSISLGETSSSQPVDDDRRLRIAASKNLIFFFFALLKMLNFCYKLDPPISNMTTHR